MILLDDERKMKETYSHIFHRERHPGFILEFRNIKLKRKSGRKRKRNNQNDKYKYFISQALYTNNFNSRSIRNKSLMNESFLDRNRFHF